MSVNLLPDSKSVVGHHVDRENYAAQRVLGERSLMSLKFKVLIVTVLVGFGILHVIGGTMIQRASGIQPIGAMMLMQNVD
jgi:hypothetical protein